MKRQIIVEIDCEDEKCGECDSRTEESGFVMCMTHGYSFTKEERFYSHRMNCCLASERKLRALIDAGNAMRVNMNHHMLEDAWDAAVKEVTG